MTNLDNDPNEPTRPKTRYVMLGLAGLLVFLGLTGRSHAAIGFAFFLIASLLLLSGVVLFSIFALTRWFNTAKLHRAYASGLWMGGWGYVLAVAAFIGYYTFETFAGRIGLRYIFFGPAILAAIIVLDMGIWRVIVQRNMPTIHRFGDVWERRNLDQAALRSTLANEVVLHRSLWSVSPFRWIRHQLIFWGFGLMFMVEMVAVMFREAFPSFGWTDIWHDYDHPIRLGFDIAFDLTGLMVLVGCLFAFYYRLRVNGTEEQKYTDTPTAVFLFVVVVTGFLTEGARLAGGHPDAAGTWASFVGRMFVPISPSSTVAEQIVWIVHALAACSFIAYIPLHRLIHSCATPIGRLVNSQKALLAKKKHRVVQGLARRFGND